VRRALAAEDLSRDQKLFGIVRQGEAGEELLRLPGVDFVKPFRPEFTTRFARWFLFKPKIPIWVNFGGP
jgi:hypothetical protein